MPAKVKKNVRAYFNRNKISIYVTPTERKKLIGWAKRNDLSLSEFCRAKLLY